jgi:hypothetical protein
MKTVDRFIVVFWVFEWTLTGMFLLWLWKFNIR